MKKSFLIAILTFLMAMTAQAQNITVHGTVISATDNDPLIGATVMCGIEGPNGVSTDIDGNFTITVPEGAELIISYIGYKTKTVLAEPSMTISLEEDSAILDEVVVVGYSTQRKVDVTELLKQISITL